MRPLVLRGGAHLLARRIAPWHAGGMTTTDEALLDTLRLCAEADYFGNRHAHWESGGKVWSATGEEVVAVDLDGSVMNSLHLKGWIEDANRPVGGGPAGTSTFYNWQVTELGRAALAADPRQ